MNELKANAEAVLALVKALKTDMPVKERNSRIRQIVMMLEDEILPAINEQQ